MPELVKSTLIELVNTYGVSLCSEPARLKSLLYDFCPSKRKEISALLLVLQEGLIPQLKKDPSALHVNLLLTWLHHATGIDKRLAKWALRVWVDALGLRPTPKPRRTVSHSGKTSTRKTAGSKRASNSSDPVSSNVTQGSAASSVASPSGHVYQSNPSNASTTSTPTNPPPAGGSGGGVALNRQWIWIPGLVLFTIFVIISSSIIRDKTSPVVPSPPAPVDSVPPDNNGTKYSVEEIAKVVQTALQESVSLSKDIYKLRSNKTALKSAQELNRLSPSYQREVELLAGNVASLTTATDKHFSGYVNNITLLDDYDASMVEAILETTRTSSSSNNEKVALELLRQHLRKYRSNHRIEDEELRRDFEETAKEVSG